MSTSRNSAGDPGSAIREAHEPGAAALPGWFVLNLCVLPTSFAVPQPRAPELRAFRFFVSRRVVDGSERFLLHMGFFRTHAEAAKWMSTLRGTYPNASISRLGGTPTASRPLQPELSDTAVLRVLAVRAPSVDAGPGDTGADAGSYSVRSQERMLGAPPQAPTAERPRPVLAPQPQTKLDNRARGLEQRESRSLADELNALVAQEIDLDNTDSLSATGVRHLNVQVQRKARRRSRGPTARKP